MREIEMRFGRHEMVAIFGALTKDADALEKEAAEAEKKGLALAPHKRELAADRRKLAERFFKVIEAQVWPGNDKGPSPLRGGA